MPVTIFILGRPGSGKSTAARHVSKVANDYGLLAAHIDDYKILYSKFKADVEHQRFRPTEQDGFDVIDSSVLDETLNEMAVRVRKMTRHLEKERLIIIEFARSDHRRALKLFNNEFLQNAYFLLLYADINTCIQRKRIIYPAKPDSHFVSEEAIRTYYSHNDIPYIAAHLKADCNIKGEKVKIIDNRRSSLSFFIEVTRYTESILKQEKRLSGETEQLLKVSISSPTDKLDQEVRISQETEPIHLITAVDESTEA